MKTAIVYHSKHHGNTKKLIDAIAQTHDITAIDATEVKHADLSEYDLVGFASGIYFYKYHKTVIEFAQQNLPEHKRVFFLYTCGMKQPGYTKSIREAISHRNPEIVGEYGCLGFDTFGPFKLVGGIAKDHPDEDDLAKAVRFYESL